MKAAIVQSYDAPPVFGDFDDPAPTAEENLIRVTAAGLHPIVRSLANGTHYGSAGVLPFVPGVDGVGTLQDGKRVYFAGPRSPFGTLSELAVAAKDMCLPLPEALDDAHAAAIANPGMSSWAALTHRAKFQSGESILILGATGAAGTLAVQIAKRMGARRIVGAGRNPEALKEILTLGADETVSLDQSPEELEENFRRILNDNEIDVVLDYLWGAPAEAALKAVKQKGLSHTARRIRFVQIGSSAGKEIALAADLLRSSGLELIGSGFGSVPIAKIMVSVGELFEEAARKPFTHELESVPLSDVTRAWTEKSEKRIVFRP
jgi:NADPH2:quinone reductase